jgi:translation initiation factor 2 beta subunit (eIF-2beta)/eIF-5
MAFDVCRECGHADDAAYGDHFAVCPKCGSRDIADRVGRWLTYHPQPTFLQWLAIPFLKDEFKPKFFRLVPEFKGEQP